MGLALDGKRVLVLGLGISGRSAANFCSSRGAHVVAADERGAAALDGLDELAAGVEIRTGQPLPDADGFDWIVPSPGIPAQHWADAGATVWGDIELAGRALEIPIVAVTGTNGKSTTVCMLEVMLRACGLRSRAAGNLGTPALSLVGEGLDIAILEVSSFQLESVDGFKPTVAVILNVSPDHLDRHGDLETYARTKRRLLEAQDATDRAVLNLDDPVVWEMRHSTPARVYGFSRKELPERGVGIDSGTLLLNDEQGLRRIDLGQLELPGVHNLENILASLTAAWAVGADPQTAISALVGFRGLPHRCEVVANVSGVTWINDSKATNAAAALRSLESFGPTLLWIAGGRDKGLDHEALAAGAAGRVRLAILIGEAAPAMSRALAGRVANEHADSLAEAVSQAAQKARAGDVVLFSPACSSFDQFESFEERGDVFRREVSELTARGASA